MAEERAKIARDARAEAITARESAERLNGQLTELRRTTDEAIKLIDSTQIELARVTDLAHERQAAIMQTQAENARLDAEVHRTTERKNKAESERGQVRKEAAQAREEAARLAGRLDTLAEQNAAMLATLNTLKATETPQPAKAAPKPRSKTGDKSPPDAARTVTNQKG